MQGSCLCATIRWRFDADFTRATHCHCQLCRKAHGAPFGTYLIGERGAFSYLCGEDQIIGFESSPGFIRSFCEVCGSVLPNPHFDDIVAIPAGVMDGDIGIAPEAHIFVKAKAAWHPITDDLPQHDYYPEQTAPAVETESFADPNDGKLRGSCLCGDVAFELSEQFMAVHNCHCSRCRKARSAAYTANGLSRPQALRFTRGEDLVKVFFLPDAAYFATGFCTRCGSCMPLPDERLDLVFTPLGALDGVPDNGGDNHIHVGSKCDWYPITDDLPQFQGNPE
ncbi:MAG: GFA family protein [Pseudomonadota bacterium]